jgi:ketosteroid isomerase-like protein
MRLSLATVLLIALAGCANTPQDTAPAVEEPDVAAVRAHIETLNALWARAYVEGTTADAVPSIFAEDAIRIAAGREPMYGRDAIQERARNNPRFHEADIELLEIEVSGNLAFTREAYTITTEQGETGTGQSLVIWKRQEDGSWKIHRIMFD